MYELRVYAEAIRLVELSVSVRERIGRRNKALANQLERCAQSVALNIAEGEWRSGGHARERFETAMGSARETKACFDVAVAMRIVAKDEVDEAWRLADGICAQLWRMTRGRR